MMEGSSINYRKWKSPQKELSRAVNPSWPTLRSLRNAGDRALTSPANLAAAPALRSQYQSKAASNSSLAASWNSTSLFAIRELGGDSLANFLPRNRRCPSRVDLRHAPP